MNSSKKLFLLLLVVFLVATCQRNNPKHLVIMSGQSNMVHLDPHQILLPALENEYGQGNVIIVKEAKGAQPISRWYKKAEKKPLETPIGDLYDNLMKKVNSAIKGKNIKTITFIWMQGERDARLANAAIYEKSLLGLYHQLSKDLNREDINFIIGRLNDFDMKNEKWPHWTKIRDIQVKVAESNPQFDWVNTDDFNTGTSIKGKQITDNIHMSRKGYKLLAKAFAIKTIELINHKH